MDDLGIPSVACCETPVQAVLPTIIPALHGIAFHEHAHVTGKPGHQGERTKTTLVNWVGGEGTRVHAGPEQLRDHLSYTEEAVGHTCPGRNW